MKSVRISPVRVRELISYNNHELSRLITRMGQLQKEVAEEEESLRQCLIQRQQLESL